MTETNNTIQPMTKEEAEKHPDDCVLFLEGELLTLRIPGMGNAVLAIPEEFIHTGDTLAYEPHEIDDHIDREAIIETIRNRLNGLAEEITEQAVELRL